MKMNTSSSTQRCGLMSHNKIVWIFIHMWLGGRRKFHVVDIIQLHVLVLCHDIGLILSERGDVFQNERLT